MANNEDEDKVTSSSDDDDDDDDEEEDGDDDESLSSSSTTTSDDDKLEDESDDDLTTSENKLTPKQAYDFLQNKRNLITKRLLELRDQLKAQPQTDIEAKKRLLTIIKSLREKWIALQTRMTNLKARLSHSPTPERQNGSAKVKQVESTKEKSKSEDVENQKSRERARSYTSSSSRSRSSSRESRESQDKPYQDLDAFQNYDEKTIGAPSSRQTTSYRDLTEDLSLSPTPSSESESIIDENVGAVSGLDRLTLNEQTTKNDDEPDIESIPKETFYNQIIPYPIVNDKRDVEILNRLIKNQLRQFEASRNNPLFDQQTNMLMYERLKKQNDFINIRMRIERLKKTKAKTQREREQNKKNFHHLLQEFRKLQRFMRSSNRQSRGMQILLIANEIVPETIPLPSSPPPETKQQQIQIQEQQQQREEETPLPRFDLNRVTGKKILFESSDSDDDEEIQNEPEVPVTSSISEPSTVPEQNELVPLPIPANLTSLTTLDAIKTRFANIINPNNVSSSTQTEPMKQTSIVNDDDDEDDDANQTTSNSAKTTMAPIPTNFNRRRRKHKRNRHKKKQNKNDQQSSNQSETNAIDQEEQWKRYVAMQLQYRFVQGANPILRALTAEAQKKLGVNQEEFTDLSFDGDLMDYETAMILQQQEEFLATAAANPFNILHNAAVGGSSSRPNLVDILSNLNGGIGLSSSEPQTPMSLLQKFFLDARNQSNSENGISQDFSSTPPTPPTLRDISVGRKIVESLTNKDINALLKSGSEHDDDDDDDEDNVNNINDENEPFSADDDSDNASSVSLFDDDFNEIQNGNNKNKDRWDRGTNSLSRNNQSSTINNKKSTAETLILPSFNRCTHLGKSTKRSAGVERMFPSFSKHNTASSSTLSLLLYGISSNP